MACGSILLACVGAVACGASERAPDDFGAADPITLNVDVEVIAEDQNRLGAVQWLGPIPSFIEDASGIYWYDENGNVFARRRGGAEVIELFAGVDSVYDRVAMEGSTRVVMSLAAGADRLYAGEALAIDDVETLGGRPPSRLLSIPKQGGPATVLLESDSELLVPFAVDGERLLVVGHGDNATRNYYQVSLASPALTPLPPELLHGPVSFGGDSFYWSDRNLESEESILSENYAFTVCPGYFLAYHWRGWGALFLRDADSGREQAFSYIGGRVDTPVCDERHVYFYNSGGSGEVVDQQQLVRVDVQSGQLTRLVSLDLVLQPDFSILRDDAENVYVKNGDTILAIRKP